MPHLLPASWKVAVHEALLRDVPRRVDRQLLHLAPVVALLGAAINAGDAYLCFRDFAQPAATGFALFSAAMAGACLYCASLAVRLTTASPLLNTVTTWLIVAASLHGLAKLYYTRDAFYHGGPILLLGLAGCILTSLRSYLLIAAINVTGSLTALWTVVPAETVDKQSALIVIANIGFFVLLARQHWDNLIGFLEQEDRRLKVELRATIAQLRTEVAVRTESETSLRASEARYRSLFDNSLVGIFRCDESGRFLMANAVLAEMLGYRAAAELTSVSLLKHLAADPNLPTSAPGELRRLLETTRLQGGGYAFRRCDDQIVPVTLHARRIVDDDQRLIGYEGLVLDITARKQAEESLRQHRERLLQVGRLASLSETLAAIAHEVNQPLNAIAGFAGASVQTIADSDDPLVVQVRKWNERIADEANRAGTIIRRLRSFAHMNQPQLAPVELPAVIDAALAITEPLFEKCQVQSRVEHDVRLPAVQIEQLLIEQVLTNLLRNACDAMSAGNATQRKVTIRTSQRGDFAEVAVTDTGSGIALEDHDQLFEPFVTTKTDGIGLGLAISRSIVEAHGGRIWTEASAQGTTFCLTLPLVKNEQRIESVPEEPS